MMKNVKTLFLVVLLFLTGAVSLCGQSKTREKLAVAKPETTVLTAEEVETLWRALEITVAGGPYELIERSDLKKMMDELQFQHWGNLVDKRGELATYHKVHAVKYVLVTNIGKLGNQLDGSLKIVDVSTGSINPGFLVNVTAADAAELKNKIAAEFGRLFAAPRPLPVAETVLLAPRIADGDSVPTAFVEKYFSLIEENALAQNRKVRSREDKVAIENTRKALLALGYDLDAQAVVDTRISSYDVRRVERIIEISGAHVVYYEGGLEMVIRVYSTLSGQLLKTVEIDCKLPPRIPSAAEADKHFRDQIKKACEAAAFTDVFPITTY